MTFANHEFVKILYNKKSSLNSKQRKIEFRWAYGETTYTRGRVQSTSFTRPGTTWFRRFRYDVGQRSTGEEKKKR